MATAPAGGAHAVAEVVAHRPAVGGKLKGQTIDEGMQWQRSIAVLRRHGGKTDQTSENRMKASGSSAPTGS